MTRAILTNFRAYTPFGHEFYKPISDYFLKMMEKYSDEFDTLYILDSGWNLPPEDVQGLKIKKIEHIDIDMSLRYYDAYKWILPKVREELVMFLDNDTLVYNKEIIDKTFDRLSGEIYRQADLELGSVDSNLYNYRNDVVSIMDTIGEYKTDKLKLGNKVCPYFFASRKELLERYLNVEWGPDMPYCETFGHLTEEMVKDGVKIYEMPDDKTGIYIDGHFDQWRPTSDTGKDLGYYHIRAGSTPAYLLATKKYGDIKTYNDYLSNQPKTELLRQCAFYQYMGGNPQEIVQDLDINLDDWVNYIDKFKKYHNLP